MTILDNSSSLNKHIDIHLFVIKKMNYFSEF